MLLLYVYTSTLFLIFLCCIIGQIYKLLKILWTIQVNSCQCERSFSCLKRLKTCLRLSMVEERLSGIALLNIERNFEINLDQIVTDFIVK